MLRVDVPPPLHLAFCGHVLLCFSLCGGMVPAMGQAKAEIQVDLYG